MSTDQGRFVWYDLVSTDAAKAESFYTDLLGWTVKEVDVGLGKYRMLHVGDDGIGGIVELDKPGIPSHWMAYVSVDDVDAACERATASGGSVPVPPNEIPNVGRFAVIADPTGGITAPFKTAHQYLPEPEPPVPFGNFAWNELLTNDVEACKRFYGEVYGWSHQVQDMGEMQYHMFMRGETMACGMMQMPAEAAGAPPHWVPYIAVDDVDAATAKLVAAGGQSWTTQEIPTIGRFSVNADPTGAAVAFYKAPAESS